MESVRKIFFFGFCQIGQNQDKKKKKKVRCAVVMLAMIWWADGSGVE